MAINDADPLREVCSGMYGGDKAFIESMSLSNHPSALNGSDAYL